MSRFKYTQAEEGKPDRLRDVILYDTEYVNLQSDEKEQSLLFFSNKRGYSFCYLDRIKEYKDCNFGTPQFKFPFLLRRIGVSIYGRNPVNTVNIGHLGFIEINIGRFKWECRLIDLGPSISMVRTKNNELSGGTFATREANMMLMGKREDSIRELLSYASDTLLSGGSMSIAKIEDIMGFPLGSTGMDVCINNEPIELFNPLDINIKIHVNLDDRDFIRKGKSESLYRVRVTARGEAHYD